MAAACIVEFSPGSKVRSKAASGSGALGTKVQRYKKGRGREGKNSVPELVP